jgi:hypothetical protein
MRTYAYNLTAGIPCGGTRARKIHAATIAKRAKNVALFLLAPFIGLAYLLAFPVIGFGMLAWVAAKAVMKNEKARPVALAIAAPVITLVFVTIGPIVGLGALAAMGAKAVLKA